MERASVLQAAGHRTGGHLGLAAVYGLSLPAQTLAQQIETPAVKIHIFN